MCYCYYYSKQNEADSDYLLINCLYNYLNFHYFARCGSKDTLPSISGTKFTRYHQFLLKMIRQRCGSLLLQAISE